MSDLLRPRSNHPLKSITLAIVLSIILFPSYLNIKKTILILGMMIKMMVIRHLISILSIILCCTLLSADFTSGTKIINEFVHCPIQDITLQDDAFHGRGYLPFIEWWYFDAKFENGYTMVFTVQIIDLIVKNIVSTRLSIYNKGITVFKNYEKYSINEFSASSEIPSITLAGKQLMVGTYNASENCYFYNLNVEVPEGSLSLEFIGCTKGWKLQQKTGDWWGVILPRANVTGTMTLYSMRMNVTGIGYHDHNWHITPRIVSNFGWFWGTCYSSNYTFTWAEVYSSRVRKNPILVVNEKDGGFLEIPSNEISFLTKKTKLDHFKLIPWVLNIKTTSETIFLVINTEVISMEHTRFFGFIDYWRYHISFTGSIIKSNHMESIEGVSIMEYLRF